MNNDVSKLTAVCDTVLPERCVFLSAQSVMKRTHAISVSLSLKVYFFLSVTESFLSCKEGDNLLLSM